MRGWISYFLSFLVSAVFVLASQAPKSEAVTLSDPNLLGLLEVPVAPGEAPRFRPNRVSLGLFYGLQEFRVFGGNPFKDISEVGEQFGQRAVFADLEYMYKEKYGFGILFAKTYGDLHGMAIEAHFNWAFYQTVWENYAFQALLGLGISHSDSTLNEEVLNRAGGYISAGPLGYVSGRRSPLGGRERAVIIAPSASLEPSLSITKYLTVGGLIATELQFPLVGARISVNPFQYFSINFHYYSIIGGFAGIGFNFPF